MRIKIVILLCLFLRLSRGKQVGSPLPTKDYTRLSVRQELYVFDKDGIAIISPKSNKVMKRINAKAKLPGTSDVMCTPDFLGMPCSWGQATFVPDRYIFAADSFGNRIIVIDIKKQLPVKAIKTSDQPHGVEYVAALGEIWVLCWSSTHINVIGVMNSTEAVISSLTDSSLLGLTNSFKIQAKGHSVGPHGYFRGGNCQNPDKKLDIAVAFYKGEPGVHVINMTAKSSKKFINLELYRCLEPKNIDFSSVKKYAFVQCTSSAFTNIVIVDVAKGRVVHSNDVMVSGVKGQPFASPDGKYVLVLQVDGVMIYYLESPSKKMVRLPDIPNTGGGFRPSGVTFIKRKHGYTAYVTSTISSHIKTIALVNNTATLTGSITNIPNNNPAFHPHQIASGCGVEDSYATVWVQDTNQTALIDTRNNTIGVVTGIQSPRQMIWVDHKSSQSQMTPSKPPKIPSSGISHVPGVVITFLAVLAVLLT